ncbi:MAG: hypothetical protein HYZ42_11175 [Bacteroidetes bacterium]|nr:hypothetical protein [Bacteroidota bacterium]
MYSKIYYILFIGTIYFSSCKSNNEENEDYALVSEKMTELDAKTNWINLETSINPITLRHKFKLLYFFRLSDEDASKTIENLGILASKHKELLIIGVHCPKFNYEKTSEHLSQLLTYTNVTFPVINDSNLDTWNLMKMRNWNSFVLLDPSNKVCSQFTSYNIFNEIERTLSEQIQLVPKQIQLDTNIVQLRNPYTEKEEVLYLNPTSIVYHNTLNRLYISDSKNNRVIACDTNGNILHIIGNGIAGNNLGRFEISQLNNPRSLYLDEDLNRLYICEENKIKIANLDTQTVEEYLPSLEYKAFNYQNKKEPFILDIPLSINQYNRHNIFFNYGSATVYEIDEQEHKLKPIFGNRNKDMLDSSSAEASISNITSMFTFQSKCYMLDKESSSLRVWNGKQVKTLIGKGMYEHGFVNGQLSNALMQAPRGMAMLNDNIYICDTYNSKIRFYNTKDKSLYTVNDSGVLSNSLPVAACSVGNLLYFSDIKSGDIYKYNPQSNRIQKLELHRLQKLLSQHQDFA